ncbi:RNA polymerase II transcription factor B 52 kDa subunit [Rhizophlyctis rosea]|uniref:RNA polymerase II transcription factor B subunit 2 n=1 Tax=Rhizophlyctis rosea TaxID=64517 RepID=A0AAD5SAH8_9FUNG|nr:RNA polymerase II transcription factor B 52 kDa subunit [Rhizophlyctis rosea]
MKAANLLSPSGITSQGFQFLLQDANTQVWRLLLTYLKLAEEQLQMNVVDVLGFIFQLGSLELGQDYSSDSLTDSQKVMMGDLKNLGLFYYRKKSTRFYPTRLATSLTSGSLMTAAKPSEEGGFIIVETNYRVYAYTESSLQIAILDLFVDLQIRFANMVMGIISRDSIRKALSNGISAEQIISFLTTHAHPEMRKQNPIIPATVVDQIRLWELERNRMRVHNGFLVEAFASKEEFDGLRKYAESQGLVMWVDEGEELVFVPEHGVDQVKEYIKRNISSGGGGRGDRRGR